MTQPEALRLAERIDGWVHQDEMNIEDAMKAADELRRLYRVSDDLRESLNHKSYYQARLTKHMRAMKEHIKEMKVQRDELLEALKMLVLATNKVSIGDYNEEVHDIALSKARAAIAKAQQ